MADEKVRTMVCGRVAVSRETRSPCGMRSLRPHGAKPCAVLVAVLAAAVCVGAPGLRLRVLATLLEKGSPPPLAKFVTFTDADFKDPDSIGTNYALAWGLCHFFVHFEKGKYRQALNSYFQALRRGATHEEADSKALRPLNWNKIEDEFRGYILELYRKR